VTTGRELAWDGCVNVRDLGGLPLAGGGTTRFGRIVRSDNVRRLSPRGWDELHSYGVRRIVDLRFMRERTDEADLPAGLDLVQVSLFGDHDPAELSRRDDVVRRALDDVDAIDLFYTDTLESRGEHVAAAMQAIASSQHGAVLVHCFVGKDRTGIVSALLLRLAGVPTEAVAEDYALSGPVVGPLVDNWIAAAEDEHERVFRIRVSAAPAEGLRRVLDKLEERWGGEEAYLRAVGVTGADIERLRARLVA
jgi:protein tyrosine/serine phosphatase